jgi:hypothetical protein
MTDAGVIIMLGPAGSTSPEQLMAAARQAATLDLITLLREHGIGPIVARWLAATSESHPFAL